MLPVGLPGLGSVLLPLNPAVPAGSSPAGVTLDSGSQVNSFLSLLQSSWNTPANDLEASVASDFLPAATPADHALRNNKGLDALLMNAASAPAGAEPNLPL